MFIYVFTYFMVLLVGVSESTILTIHIEKIKPIIFSYTFIDFHTLIQILINK